MTGCDDSRYKTSWQSMAVPGTSAKDQQLQHKNNEVLKVPDSRHGPRPSTKKYIAFPKRLGSDLGISHPPSGKQCC